MKLYLLKAIFPFLLGAILIYAFWFLAVILIHPAPYILPHPLSVLEKLLSMPGQFLYHTWITTLAFGSGLLIGLVLAFIFSVLSIRSEKLAALISPLMVIMQSVPKIALAPLFVIWFGYGLGPKVVIAALISFFPIYINLVGGMRAVDNEFLDYAATLRMSPWSTIFKIRLPFALPYFFAALKMAAIYSVVGAIVGEFVGSDKGLGYLIIQGDLSFDSALLFAAIHVLVAIGVILYLGVSLLEIWALRWKVGDSENVGFMVTA
ncbi:MAG: ABC transporter permease [Candidatus Sumerlaeota bacterium]|nr:ABC transporter permease [Candidatus Sumerlaeota bacterium]